MTTTHRLLTASIALRGLLGAAAYVAPDQTARSMGIDPAANPAAPYLGRVFGARDVALAILAATATGSARRNILVGCAAIDVADTCSALLGRRGGYLDDRSTVALSGVAIAALLPELLELAQRSRT